MSDKPNETLIKECLLQLRCHFTWGLQIDNTEMLDLENRVFDQIEFLDVQCNTRMYNLLAYVKHLAGQNQEALESLKEAEDFLLQEFADQSDVRGLVTWGNYAWLYHHMGRLGEAQTYLDKVEKTCKKLASPFSHRMECPELDCEEGWALLKCGRNNYERAKVCFEKALEVDPTNPEFSVGYAIVTYRLNNIKRTEQVKSLDPLKQAIRLNPENEYVKVLLALCLQDLGQEDEGEKYIEEALASKTSHTYVLRYAAKFHRRKGSLDKALQLLHKALKDTPCSALVHHQIGLCYKAQIIQNKKVTHWQPRGQDRENIGRLARLVIDHLECAVKHKPTFVIAYIDLAEIYIEIGDYCKAEDTYQKVLSMKSLSEEDLQQLHLHYGKFQEFQRKSEVNAIINYLKAVKIEKASFSRDKSISALEKCALKKLRKNEFDVEGLSLLGFVQKQKGEITKALESYEQALKLAAGQEKSLGHKLKVPKP
ncbi:interferon-induced protein with tetratricopeptide repeats 1-like [Sorex araneus]|uniref:interferon-induced protein with tetratricopeptide repeats 1-like n=1 Tax=Sorex araneus TaxID=42254 RepID=UPI0024339265|nr:interferon-induced protein with tetratricopeptide repeats 1-like [Sorex araneus]